MPHYYLTIISKNKSSVKNFFIFFDRALNNFNVVKKYLKKPNKKKFFTILKSPHVNKAAQEQFETKLFLSQINIHYSPKSLQFLVFLKKVKIYLFPDIKIKIKFNFNKSLLKKTQSKMLNPNSFKLDFFSTQLQNKNLKKSKQYKADQYNKQKFNLLKKTKSLLKIFDTYGSLIKQTFR